MNQIVAHIYSWSSCVSYHFLFLAVMTECVDTRHTGYAVDGVTKKKQQEQHGGDDEQMTMLGG